jgi:hypothetical protein
MITCRHLVIIALAARLTVFAGCSSPSGNEHEHAEPDGGSTTRVDAQPPSPAVKLGALGSACSSNAECASDHCTDGVCCDSACDQTCYACNLSAAPGHCAALKTGGDSNASPTCTSPWACFLPVSSSVPACKLVDGTACQGDSDCMSGHCLTYYVDADGDGYGTSEAARFCAELNSPPPAGYASYSGDCCDLDAGANPGFNRSLFLQMPDACGGYDWNCDGQIQQEGSCPAAVACGAPCVLSFGFASVTLFTAACQ